MAYRVPEWRIAERLITSDVAAVGLHAMQLLRGDFEWLLWGTQYQGALEPLLTAPLLALFAERPAQGLMAGSLLGHLVLVLALFALCVRPLGPGRALLAVATVAFGPCELHNLSIAAPRIWSLALFALALVAAERGLEAAERARPFAPWLGLATLLLGLSYYSDMFVVLMLPGAALYALFAARALPGAARWRALGAALAGLALGLLPVVALKMSPGSGGALSFNPAKWNWPLFFECTLHTLGWTRFAEGQGALRAAISIAGIAAFAALCAAGVGRALSRHSTPLERRLAACGAGWIAAAVGLFLATNRPIDVWSSRYLAPVVLALPLLLPAALGWAWPSRWRVPAAAAVALVAGYFFAEGRLNSAKELAQPLAANGSVIPSEDALHAEFRKQGVGGALAEFWTAYRLTFLWREAPVVVDADGSRHKPYLEVLKSAKRTAVLFGRKPDPEAPIEEWERALSLRGISHQRGNAGGFTYLLIDGPISSVALAHRLEVAAAPLSLAPGARGAVKVTARNTGDFSWRRGATFPAYHLLSRRGEVLLYDGERTLLPRDVHPGETVEVEVGVVAPLDPGEYVVELDLVEEGVTWFKDRGSETRQVALTVAR